MQAHAEMYMQITREWETERGRSTAFPRFEASKKGHEIVYQCRGKILRFNGALYRLRSGQRVSELYIGEENTFCRI